LGGFALFLLEVTPLARKDIYSQLPLVGGFWERKLEQSQRQD
jgi:Ubiquinol-cytochrome-c reductase complex subunit (QCR10)